MDPYVREDGAKIVNLEEIISILRGQNYTT